MTTHICRDFLCEGISSLQIYHASLYLVSIFLHGVLNYTIVGQTTLDIEGSYLVSSGTAASININSTQRFVVEIPSAQYTVTISDINRIIALRSDANPSYNSGLFRITSVDTANNRLYIDYRSATIPPAEVSAISWKIYKTESDVTFSVSDNNAGSNQYETQGAGAAASRIILQSPTNAWQVRLCLEGTTDQYNLDVRMSIAPGIGGDSRGDFAAGGSHCHMAQYYNLSSQEYTNFVIGVGQANDNSQGGWRFYMWGSNDPDNVLFMFRDAGGGVNKHGWCSFGMTEYEQEPIPENIIHRLYAVGNSSNNESMSWSSSYQQSSNDGRRGGCAFGLLNRPVSAVTSTYCRLAGQQLHTQGIKDSSFASDSSITKQTELLLVDIVAGTWDAMNWSGQGRAINTEARRIGTIPFARMGRSNFGDWSLAVNINGSWFHSKSGIYLPWNGPSILP